MQVRTANFGDITQVVLFAGRQHAASSFAHIPFNAARFRRNLREVIRGTNGDALIAVRDDGSICGLLIAWHEQMIWSNALYATDIHFVAEAGGDALLREFARWAAERGCVEAGSGTFNGVDEPRIQTLYERLGWKTTGHTFRKELLHEHYQERHQGDQKGR